MKRFFILRPQVKRLIICVAVLVSASFISSKAADNQHHFTHNDTLRGALNPARTAYDVYYYHLDILIDPAKQTITGTNSISFLVKKQTDSIQVDLFENYNVMGVMSDRLWLQYTREGDHIFVHFYDTLKPGEKRTITVHYSGKPPVAKNAPWDGGFVWGKDSLNRDWVGVACEGLGASSWWPCKDHLSDKPDSMRISIGVPEGYFCVSNGQLKQITNLYSGYYRYDWLVTYPINTYDVTCNIGKYDRIRYTYNSKAGKLDLDYFVLDYHKKSAESYFQNQVKPMLDCFEKYFGPYPFTRDGYALVETKYWGMEHQGAIAYGNNFAINKHGFDFIIVHESAHEWWGNSLSVPDQAEMWIHESFATYAEALYLECQKGKDSAQAYLDEQKRYIVNQQPMIGPMGVNFYKRTDNDIYYKGAWMLHTLRNVIDDDSMWFAIVYGFQQRYKYGIVTTDIFLDFLRSMEISGISNSEKESRKKQKVPVSYGPSGFAMLNKKAFLDQYLRQPQLPTLQLNTVQKGKKVTITYSWKNVVTGFNMPVDIDINGWKMRLYPREETTQKITIKPGDLPKALNVSTIKAENIKVLTDHFLINVE
jgi:aminopeptidase N